MDKTEKQYESNKIDELALEVIEPDPDRHRFEVIPFEGPMPSIKYDKIYKFALEVIEPDPDQPRSEAIPSKGLITSIKNNGIRQPILVRYENGKIIIIDERRYNAAKEANLETVPVRFDWNDDREKAFGVAFSLNFHRKDLTVIEIAEALRKIQDHEGINQTELGKKIGINQSATSEYLGLMNLPECIRDECRKDPNISKRFLIKISKITSAEVMEKAFNDYQEKKKPSEGKRVMKQKEKSLIKCAKNDTEALKKRYEKIVRNFELCDEAEKEQFKSLLTKMEAFIIEMKVALNE